MIPRFHHWWRRVACSSYCMCLSVWLSASSPRTWAHRFRRIEWTSKGALSLLLQASLVAPHEDQGRDGDERAQHDCNRSDRPCQPMDIITEEVASQSIERGPGDAPQCVVNQEGSPRHAVGPGQERGPGTQDGNKAPKEDHFAAMLAEEVLPQFHFALIEAKVMTVAAQQTIAAFTPHPVAEIMAYNRPQGRRRDHQRNGEAVSRPGIDGRHEQHGLAPKGDSHTLDGHKEQHRPIAIDRQKMHQLGCGKMEHAVLLSPPPLTKSPL